MKPVVGTKQLALLRSLASASEAEDFVELCLELLGRDFETTFEFLKAQKLLSKFRNLGGLEAVSSRLEAWVRGGAPLSGKNKARFRRHLQVCKLVAEMFGELERQSSVSPVWRLSRDAFALKVLGKIEWWEQVHESVLAAQMSPLGDDPFKNVERMWALHGALRGFTDAANRLLSMACTHDFGNELDVNEADVAFLFNHAVVADSLQAAFDNYSFHGWEPKIGEKRLLIRPRFNDLDNAGHWAQQRREAADFRDLRVIGKLELELHEAPPEAPITHGSFEEYILSDAGRSILLKAKRPSEFLCLGMKGEVSAYVELSSSITTT
ncbi:MAG: hypothetical protein ACRD2L_10115, partial [Terriglobia bacterium]